MTRKRTRPKAQKIRVTLPSWIMGGAPELLAELCDWDIESTEEPDVWKIRTKESIHGTDGKLLQISKMADRANSDSIGAYSRLNRLKSNDGIIGQDIWRAAQNTADALLKRFPEEPAALWSAMQILISASPTAKEATLTTKNLFTDYILNAVENPTLYLVEHSSVLSYRYTASRMLLSTRNNVDKSNFKEDRLISRSSHGLFRDTSLGLDAYISCLCACLSPDVWVYPIGRPGGVILVVFGEAVRGQETFARDEIQLLSPSQKFSKKNPYRPENPAVYEHAAKWWVGQLNTMFSIITEPSNYDVAGFYDAAESTERLLTVEQVFRDCQSILTLTRDAHARTTLVFTLLKRLEGLIPGYTWKKAVGLKSLESLVEQLKVDVPSDLHEIFLWRADRAVHAVKSLEDGFFGSKNSVGTIPLPDKQGRMIETDHENAVTQWLQLVRNSLHGFNKPSPRDRALLAAHDGNIPPEFADVAWLHVLDIVAHPEKLDRFTTLQRKNNTS